jgi:hypothetical protein
MRDLGPFGKKPKPKPAERSIQLKPDPACAVLTPQELHAYYIAIISSVRIFATREGAVALQRDRSR